MGGDSRAPGALGEQSRPAACPGPPLPIFSAALSALLQGLATFWRPASAQGSAHSPTAVETISLGRPAASYPASAVGRAEG